MINNIVFDCERMKYANTGLYQYCYNLGSQLKRQVLPGKESITFFTPPGRQELFGPDSDHLIQTDLYKLIMPSLDGYQIWHATHQDTQYLPVHNKKIGVVLTIHDLNFMYDESKSAQKKKHYLGRVQRLIRRADRIVCVSDYTCSDVQRYCNLGGKSIRVIRNGTNSLEIPLLHKHSYLPTRSFIFSLGTITLKKNFHTLLSLLLPKRNMELVIAGRVEDPAYYQFILDTANRKGLNGRLKMLGQISENEKSWYLNNCCAFAFPSVAEGFGLPVAEAMSVGKPLFLSQRTALPEIGGQVAYYFKDFSANNMNETFEKGMNHYEQNNMQETIRKKGSEYCWANAANEYLEVYRSLF